MRGDDPRTGAARRRYRDRAAQSRGPCHLCGRPIDYSLRAPPTPWRSKPTTSHPSAEVATSTDPSSLPTPAATRNAATATSPCSAARTGDP